MSRPADVQFQSLLAAGAELSISSSAESGRFEDITVGAGE
jgi:hypothetical protein